MTGDSPKRLQTPPRAESPKKSPKNSPRSPTPGTYTEGDSASSKPKKTPESKNANSKEKSDANCKTPPENKSAKDAKKTLESTDDKDANNKRTHKDASEKTTPDGQKKGGKKGDGKRRNRNWKDRKQGLNRKFVGETKRERFEAPLKLKYDEKGFGIIDYQVDGKDVFAHRKSFKKTHWELSQRGDVVSFYYKIEDDKPKAFGIKINNNALLAERAQTIGEKFKKALYPEYIPRKELIKGLQDGSLKEGILRVNPKKPSMAFVDLGNKNSEKDYLVKGNVARNRAVHGDQVVVRLVSDDDKKKAEEENEDGEDSSDSDDDNIRDVEIVDEEDTTIIDEDNHSFKLAEVVYIGDYSGRNRTFVCTLCPNSKEGQAGKTSIVKENEKFVKAIPVDTKLPWILIYLNDTMKSKLKVPGRLNRFMYWPVKIKKWDECSVLPLGELGEDSIGEAGDAEAEVQKALAETELDEHNIDFSDEIEEEVEEIVEKFNASFEEVAKTREDLRKRSDVRVMTIDPATAKDLDDAIHVRSLPGGVTEFGVHIADVAHFVKPGTLTDKMAKFRCTSVYMPDRVLPMLPRALCNHLCSLNPNENKCAFSCYFRIDKQGNLMLDKENEPWIKKTVINTCVRFNYDQVQEIYDGKILEGDERPDVYHGHSWDACVKDLHLIHRVCRKIRDNRFNGGALALRSSKMIFKTREGMNFQPIGYSLEVHSASHWVIEELMLLANKCVARIQMLHPVLDGLACLRNHAAPDPKKSKRIYDLTALCGINYTNTNAGDLHQCLQRIGHIYGGETLATISMLTMKCGMKAAAYFIGEAEAAHHFALNFDMYTHFTSPIRRYADVMVHRVLNAILEGKTVEEFHNTDMDEDDRNATSETQNNPLKNMLPQLNAADLDEPEYDKHGKVKSGKEKRKAAMAAGVSKEDYQAERMEAVRAEKSERRRQAAIDAGEDPDAVQGEREENPFEKQAQIALGNQCKKCNEKKKASKDCQMELDRAWFCMLLRNQKYWWYKQAVVTEINRDHIVVYAHEIGKEKKVYFDTRDCHNIPELFIEGVNDEVFLPDEFEYVSKSHVDVTWSNRRVCDAQFLYGEEAEDIIDKSDTLLDESEMNPTVGRDTKGIKRPPPKDDLPPPPGLEHILELGVGEEEETEDENDDTPKKKYKNADVRVEQQTICMLSVVPIVLIPTKTVPIDFVMLLCSPFHPKWREVKITDKERKGFDNAPPSDDEAEDSNDDGDDGADGDKKKKKRGGKKGKGGGKKKK